jgi:non-ribosomal peptide synthetase component F
VLAVSVNGTFPSALFTELHLLLSVYAILLYRYTAQSSILIAMPVSSREGNELFSKTLFSHAL